MFGDESRREDNLQAQKQSNSSKRNEARIMASRRSMYIRDSSPKGVRDIFELELSVENIKAQQEYKNLHCESIVDVDVRESKTQEDEAREEKLNSLRRQIEETKQKLQKVETLREKDKKDLEDKKGVFKEVIRMNLKKKYADVFAHHKLLDQHRDEVKKIKNYLKNDNRRIRSEIRKLDAKLSKAERENAELEAINKETQAKLAEARKTVQKLEETQQRLLEYSKQCKATLKAMKHELREADAYHKHEANLAFKFENWNRKFMKRISSRGNNALVQHISSIASDGMLEAMGSRAKELGNVDETNENLTPKQRKTLRVNTLEEQLKRFQESFQWGSDDEWDSEDENEYSA